jgi:hypothetical protein
VDAADQNQHAQNGSCHRSLTIENAIIHLEHDPAASSSTPVTRLEQWILVVGRRRRHSGLIPTVLSSISASGKQRLLYRLRSPPLLQLHRLARLRWQAGWLRTSTDAPEFMGSHQVSKHGSITFHNGRVEADCRPRNEEDYRRAGRNKLAIRGRAVHRFHDVRWVASMSTLRSLATRPPNPGLNGGVLVGHEVQGGLRSGPRRQSLSAAIETATLRCAARPVTPVPASQIFDLGIEPSASRGTRACALRIM